MNNNRTKNMIIIALCFVALVSVIGLGNILSHIGKTAVFIEVAPSTATTTLDEKSVHSGTVYLKNGQHLLRSSLGNFTPENRSFTVSGQPQTVSLSLNPSNDAGRRFLADNPTYQTEREAISGRETQARSDVATTPIITLLPVINLSAPYKIDFGQSQTRKNGTVIVIGGSSPEGRQKALQWIRSKGYDPSSLEIQFTDFINPLLSNGRSTPQASNRSGDGGE